MRRNNKTEEKDKTDRADVDKEEKENDQAKKKEQKNNIFRFLARLFEEVACV